MSDVACIFYLVMELAKLIGRFDVDLFSLFGDFLGLVTCNKGEMLDILVQVFQREFEGRVFIQII